MRLRGPKLRAVLWPLARLVTGRAQRRRGVRRRPKRGNAGGEKHRRRVRGHTKQRSMWREIQCRAFLHCSMLACCADTSSDDDEQNTSNTLLLLFAPTPSSRPSSWWPCSVASLWTFSPLRSKIGLNLNPIFWLTIPGATSCSGARLRLGSQPTARVDVHLCRLPHFACLSLEGSPQPEPPWLTPLRRTTFLCPCETLTSGPRVSGVRLAVGCALSWPTLSPISLCFDLICAIPCLSSSVPKNRLSSELSFWELS